MNIINKDNNNYLKEYSFYEDNKINDDFNFGNEIIFDVYKNENIYIINKEGISLSIYEKKFIKRFIKSVEFSDFSDIWLNY